jgi:hypothetical protein
MGSEINDESDDEKVQDEKQVEKKVYSVEDLFNAIRYGTRTHIMYICDQDKSIVNQLDDQGYSCIHWAAKRGDYEILQDLNGYGANMEIASSYEARMKPVHWAASDGKLSSVKFFFDNRFDINAQDSNGCTPVIIATQYNRIATVIFLIKNGADLTLKDANGDTALHWAAYKGHEEMCGLLLHFAPRDLEEVDIYGQTPLHLAALRGNHDAVEYLIRDHQADASVKDKNGCTPLELSVKKNQVRSEWAIRLRTSKSYFDLIRKLGLGKLRDSRILLFLCCGFNQQEQSVWIWRISFLSNFIATAVNIYYTLQHTMADLYVLHLLNTIVNFMWWIAFFATLWKSPSFVVDRVKDGNTSKNTSKSPNKSTSKTVSSSSSSLSTSSTDSQDDEPRSYDDALDKIGNVGPASLMAIDDAYLPNMCHTCRVLKPLRSKHCRVTRRCINKFDHYCPFVYNAVGRDNYKYFFALVCMHPICYGLFALTTSFYISRVSISTWFVLFLVYASGMGMMVTGLTMYHCKLIMSNLTTNEDSNKFRYSYLKDNYGIFSNPFDLGNKWKNAQAGLLPSSKLYYSRNEVLRDRASGEMECRQLGTDDLESNTSGSSKSSKVSSTNGKISSSSLLNMENNETEGFFEESRRKREM